MIKANKDFESPPPILISVRCQNKTIQALKERSNHEYCTHCCGQEVRDALRKLYNDKCAYCESNIEAGAVLRIEHYRPRKKIKEEEENSSHGYYWLTYEWSNLLPACETCNRIKSCSFPIGSTGKRASAPIDDNGELSRKECHANSKTLTAEKPLLLHPELDNPEEHFIFLPNGEMEGVTERGRHTIEICGLNREALVEERKRIIDEYTVRMSRLMWSFSKGKRDKKTLDEDLTYLLIDLILLQNPEERYSSLGCFMFENFEYFFIKPGTPWEEHQEILIEAYKNFIE